MARGCKLEYGCPRNGLNPGINTINRERVGNRKSGTLPYFVLSSFRCFYIYDAALMVMTCSSKCYSAQHPTFRGDSTGKERDAETGLDFFLARHFSGAQGRFLSPDEPLLYADPDNPQSWNLYSYGLNSPLVYTDLHGHEAVDPCEKGTSDQCVVVTAEAPPASHRSVEQGQYLEESAERLCYQCIRMQ
jgi:RHS repeat-associated protein